MDKSLANISALESFLYDKLAKSESNVNGVSENAFISALPQNIDEDWKDMLVIDCGTPIYDNNAYASGIATIVIYTKPMIAGVKDISLSKSLDKQLRKIIDENNLTHLNYVLSVNQNYTDYDEVRDLYMNVWILNVSII